jgi:hypothetical protein
VGYLGSRRNVIRRHLTPTQLALLAYDALPLFEAEGKKRQREHGGTAPGKSKNTGGNNSTTDSDGLKARTQAAKSVGINPHYISDVKMISEKYPALLSEMRSGKVTIAQALKQIAGLKEERLNLIDARASHKKDESLPTLREKLIESGGVYLIKYAQVHRHSEEVKGELESISEELWETFQSDPEYGSIADPDYSDTTDVD